MCVCVCVCVSMCVGVCVNNNDGYDKLFSGYWFRIVSRIRHFWKVLGIFEGFLKDF